MAVHTHFVERIVHCRSIARMGKHKELHWKVQWNSGDVTHEPLCNLVDAVTYLEDIEPVLEDYIKVAKQYPHLRRKCITCNRNVFNGKVFCNSTKRCKKYQRYAGRVMS